MKNPNGPYPGRQLFVGETEQGNPAIAYLVTGRSPASRERLAVPIENGIRIGPLGNAEYDPLRHYNGVRYDPSSGVLAVSNGIQTDAIYETYKLLYNVESQPTKDYMELIMTGAKAEPDSLMTPRIAGAVARAGEGAETVYIVGIVTEDKAEAYQVAAKPTEYYGVSTYHGDMEAPGAFDLTSGLAELAIPGNEPADIARQLYDMSEATNNGEDIRVCAIGGVLADGKWSFHIINRHAK